MSILFSDIFEAIRTIRASKGTSEKDILNYVQEKVGGRMSVNNVLKTVCTLNKLVDEGILIKRGKRYSLPKPLRKREEHVTCKEEIKETVNDAKEEPKELCDDPGRRGEERRGGQGDEVSDDDQICEEDDEDDEDDEDEDDDDDEDDDNVSQNSNDYDESVEKKRGKNEENSNEAEVSANAKRNLNIRCLNNNENKNDYCKGCMKSKNVVGESKCKKVPEKKSITGRRRKKGNGGTINSCKIPEGEEVVFCAPDFIDEQEDNAQEEFSKMEEVMEVEADAQDKSKEISSIFQAKRRKSHSKRSHASNSRYRSRSPIKVPSTGTFQQRLAKDQADEKRPPEKKTDIHQKTHQEFLERDTERPNAGVKGGRNNCHRSDSVSSVTPKNSFVYVKREKSSGSNQGKEEHKMEQKPESGVDVMNQCGLKRRGDSSMTKLKVKSKLKGEASEAKKRKKSMMPIKCENDDGYAVLCSVCEKKKAKK